MRMMLQRNSDGKDTTMNQDELLPGVEPLSDSSSSSVDRCLSERTRLDGIPLEIGCCSERHVSFGSLEVRTYPMILGDHPDCCLGPPVTIGWEPFNSTEISLDVYESNHYSRRRSYEDLHLSWIQRKQILREQVGASDEEMRQAACDAFCTRQKRLRSHRMRYFEFLQLRLESLRKLTMPNKHSRKAECI